jgi:hypothetical protein
MSREGSEAWLRRFAVVAAVVQLCVLACGRIRKRTDEPVVLRPEPVQRAPIAPSATTVPPAPSARSEDDGWVLVRDEDGLFEVLMPSTPPMKQPSPSEITLSVDDLKSGSFYLSVSLAPPDKSMAGNAQGILDAVERGIVSGLGNRRQVAPAKRFTVSGYPARLLFFGPSGPMHFEETYLLCFARNQYLYRMRHFGPRAARERSFGSLKVAGVPRARPEALQP